MKSGEDFYNKVLSLFIAIGLNNQIWHWGYWINPVTGRASGNNFASILYGIQMQLNDIAANIKILMFERFGK